MRPGPFRNFIQAAFLLMGVSSELPCWAEHGYVLVQVKDARHSPVQGVEVGIDGFGEAKLTNDQGKAKIAIGSATKEGESISLVIVHSPPGKNFVIISPWDGSSLVPSFEDKPSNFVRVVVVQWGDRAALESGTDLVAALAAKIVKANSSKSVTVQAQPEDPKKSLVEVAKEYGLKPDEVDRAIRAWGAKTTDPYEAGFAELYERDYPKASAQLQDSLSQREEKLSADQDTVTQDRKQVADAAFYLGISLNQQRNYEESAQAFEKCLQYRPDDPLVLGEAAINLAQAGELARAEPLFSKSVGMFEKKLGPNDPSVAVALNNWGIFLLQNDELERAEPLLRRALAIDENAPRQGFSLANTVGNLAYLLIAKGDDAGAEQLYRHWLEIDKIKLGPNHRDVATMLYDLADLHVAKGDLTGADPLYRQALAINEIALGPNHPEVAFDLYSLGLLLSFQGHEAESEQLYRRALAIDEKALGPNDPTTLDVRRKLDHLLAFKKLREKGEK